MAYKENSVEIPDILFHEFVRREVIRITDSSTIIGLSLQPGDYVEWKHHGQCSQRSGLAEVVSFNVPMGNGFNWCHLKMLF